MKASLIGHDIEVVVLEVRGNIVRLGIKAPGEIAVVRSELLGKPANVVNDKQGERPNSPAGTNQTADSDPDSQQCKRSCTASFLRTPRQLAYSRDRKDP